MKATFLLVALGFVPSSDAAAEKEKAEGFVPLFNGKDLTAWKVYDGKPDSWAVEDGLLVCTGKGGGWLGTNRDYANFVMRLEYRLGPAGNSGVYLRAPESGHISRVGMEIQLLDDRDPKYAQLDFYQYTGSIYHVVPPTRRAGKPAKEWNSIEIRAEGRRVRVAVNGIAVVDADLDREMRDPEVAKEHPGLARRSGRLGLQNHHDRIEFRNIRVRELE
jgi:hypothetical protein